MLLAVIPHLLGFIPQASVVVIGTAPPRDRIRLTVRYDLPGPGGPAAADLAAHVADTFAAQGLSTAVAACYGPEPLVTPVAGAMSEAMLRAGIELREFLRVENLRYWSYMCSDEACCPAAGTPLDPELHSAETLAAFGFPVLASRAALAAQIAPLGGSAAESMRQATRRAERHTGQLLARARQSGRPGPARQAVTADSLAAVSAIIARYRDGGECGTDDEIARITVALRELRVRDDAWARMDPGQAEAHLRLWTDVVRRAQPGYVAAPAGLLAFVAWQRGDGALANVALDRAEADDPRYSMALLLRQVITEGTSPRLARLPMTPEEVAASYAGQDEADSPA
jgi:hypothetical protein